jgi:hypothetical protein
VEKSDLFSGFVLLVFGCIHEGKPAMSYSVSPCNLSDSAGTSFKVNESEGAITIHQKHSYVCCANITMYMQSEDKTIRIYEDNIGEMCRCICPFKADIEITNAAGFENLLPQKVDDGQGPIRLIHHGRVGPSRKIETMIEMMDHLDPRFELNLMLDLSSGKSPWRPPVIKTVATLGEGIPELTEKILEHREFLQESGKLLEKRNQRAREEIVNLIEKEISKYINNHSHMTFDMGQVIFTDTTTMTLMDHSSIRYTS